MRIHCCEIVIDRFIKLFSKPVFAAALLSFFILIFLVLPSISCGRSNRVIDRETYAIYRSLQDTVQKLQIYGYARLRFFKIADGALSKGLETKIGEKKNLSDTALADSLRATIETHRTLIEEFAQLNVMIQQLKPNADRPDSVIRYIILADSLAHAFYQKHSALNQTTQAAERQYVALFGKKWSLDSLPQQRPMSQNL